MSLKQEAGEIGKDENDQESASSEDEAYSSEDDCRGALLRLDSHELMSFMAGLQASCEMRDKNLHPAFALYVDIMAGRDAWFEFGLAHGLRYTGPGAPGNLSLSSLARDINQKIKQDEPVSP
jgi:hypothetical protein